MSNLKKSFNEKMHVAPTKHFDMDFKRKLNQSNSDKKFTIKWFSWAGGAAVTLFVFLFVLKQQTSLSYPHQHYVDTIIQVESYEDESLEDESIDETIDLTSSRLDEI